MPLEDPDSLSSFILVTVDGVIHIGPCIFHSCLLAADGANEDAQIFDSVSGNANEKFHLEAISGTTFGWRSTDGILFHQGIYVKVKDTGAHVMIEFHPLKLGPKNFIAAEV